MNRPVRARIRRALPSDTFVPRPWRALLLPAWGTVAVGLAVAIVHAGLPWWADLGLALLLGHTMGVLGFVGHEILHGSTVRDRRLQDALGWFAFLPFLVSPTLWREWHNRRHHSHANQGHRDPDSFGHVKHYGPDGARRGFRKLLPGSEHPSSFAFLLYWFTFHNAFILLLMSRRFRDFDRRPALIGSGLQALTWVGVIAWAVAFAGWEVVWVTAVPMMAGNALLMGYIATNHMMRPELDHDEPVDNSMSVRVPRLLDVVHGWFSHHVEHHLFPAMSPAMAPRVRAWLEDQVPERYVAPSWPKALWWLYRTPRPHADADTLVDPDRPERRVDLDRLAVELRDDRFERLSPSRGDQAA